MLAGALAWLFAPSARAEPPPAPSNAAQAADSASDRAASKRKKKRESGATPDGRRESNLEPFGRVLLRAEFERHERAEIDPRDDRVLGRRDSLDLLVPLARLGLRYRAPVSWLSAEVELDVADQTMKDAWVRAREDFWSVRAGQFKLPFSAIEMDSSFTLPLARRGVVSDLLTESLEVAGRRPGLEFGLRKRGELDASLVVGAFQGSVLVFEDGSDRDVELANEDSLDSQSLVARGELEIEKLELGVNYEHRVGTDREREPSHYWTVGADAVLDAEFGENGLRIWAEWLQGASYFEHALKPPAGRDAMFVTLRLITAFRFGGTRRGGFYVEPYGMLAMFDPDTDVTADVMLEQVLGVNVGLYRRLRAGIELERQYAQPNFPARYLLDENGHRKAVVLHTHVSF